jgi:DNA-binding response OmpR family regulator
VGTPETYSAACHNCQGEFDALDATWCSCLVTERTLVCAPKVVVMTALYTNVKYRTEGFKVYKVDDYMAKPLTFEDLRAILQKHLG